MPRMIWVIAAVVLGTASVGRGADLPTDFCFLMNKNSGKVMGVLNRATKNGSQCVQWEGAKKEANQQWKLVPAGDDHFQILNASSNKVLGVLNAATDEGAQIVIWEAKAKAENQLWKLVPVEKEPGYYKLVNKASGKVIGVESGSKKDGARLLLWSDANDPNQWWSPVP